MTLSVSSKYISYVRILLQMQWNCFSTHISGTLCILLSNNKAKVNIMVHVCASSDITLAGIRHSQQQFSSGKNENHTMIPTFKRNANIQRIQTTVIKVNMECNIFTIAILTLTKSRYYFVYNQFWGSLFQDVLY